jgi:hypothetical protein
MDRGWEEGAGLGAVIRNKDVKDSRALFSSLVAQLCW